MGCCNIKINVKTRPVKLGVSTKLMATGKQAYPSTVELDMVDGDQILEPIEGRVFSKVTVKKPDTLVAENIRKDISMMSYSVYLLELADRVYKHEGNNLIYDLLIASLKKIDEGFDYKIIVNIFELKMLDFLGIKPVVDECVNCGNKVDIVTVSSYRGGYLCKNCCHGEVIVNIKTIKLLRMFYYVDIFKITKLDVSENIKKELSRFIDDYYDRYSGIYLKSKEFLQNLEKI